MQLPTLQITPAEQFSRDWRSMRNWVMGTASSVGTTISDVCGPLWSVGLQRTNTGGAHNVSFAFDPSNSSQNGDLDDLIGADGAHHSISMMTITDG